MPKDPSANYYQNNKERLQKKKTCGRYQSLSKNEEKRQYGQERHKNLPEEGKQKPVKYRKNNNKMKKKMSYYR